MAGFCFGHMRQRRGHRLKARFRHPNPSRNRRQPGLFLRAKAISPNRNTTNKLEPINILDLEAKRLTIVTRT